MKSHALEWAIVMAMGMAGACTQERPAGSAKVNEETLEAQPAGGYVHPAESGGYMDTMDPEAFPPTPGTADMPQ